MATIPDVLASAGQVVGQARRVRIDRPAGQRWARARRPADFQAPWTPPELTVAVQAEDLPNLTLLRSCLNFCFWPEEAWAVEFRGRSWTRTYAMYAAVLRGIEEDPAWLTAQRWASADAAAVAHLLRGSGRPPLLAERRAVLNETGRRLLDGFGGAFGRVVEAAGQHARRLAYLLAEEFPPFRDVALYGGREVALLKRAQICAADLHGVCRGRGQPGLAGMGELTVLADYRLPQYLRHIGVIHVDKRLAERIQSREELPPGCPEEVELRSATIVAGEVLRRALGETVSAWHLDFYLWQGAHDPEIEIEHHRTRTIYY